MNKPEVLNIQFRSSEFFSGILFAFCLGSNPRIRALFFHRRLLTDREEVYRLLTEYTKSKSLIRHSLAVEAAMRAYARKYGEDEERWGAVGLIHDFDYEQHPSLEEHPFVGCEILRPRGRPRPAAPGGGRTGGRFHRGLLRVTSYPETSGLL